MIYIVIEAWGNATNYHLEQLYLVQMKMTKMISFSNYNTPSITMIKQLNILPLNKRNALINLYHSYIYIYTIILYIVIEAWGNATNYHLEQLYLVQMKMTKMISFSNYNTPSITMLKQLNILPLNKLVVNRIGLMMYKYANNLFPPAINDIYCNRSMG